MSSKLVSFVQPLFFLINTYRAVKIEIIDLNSLDTQKLKNANSKDGKNLLLPEVINIKALKYFVYIMNIYFSWVHKN